MSVSGQLHAPEHFTPAKAPPVSTEQEDGCAPKNMDTLESRTSHPRRELNNESSVVRPAT